MRRTLTDTDIANGFGNRFLFTLARRSKIPPGDGNLDELDIESLARRVTGALEQARRIGRVHRSPEAEARWDALYRELANEKEQGLAAGLLARADAQLLRLSLIYALLDESSTIERAHLDAAEALWRYRDASVRSIFGDAIGDVVADKLFTLAGKAGTEGIDREAQFQAFSGHANATRMASARELLVRLGRCVEEAHGLGRYLPTENVYTSHLRVRDHVAARSVGGARQPRGARPRRGGDSEDRSL